MIYIIIWLLLGALAVWMEYHTAKKEWWDIYHEDYSKFNNGDNSLRMLLVMSPFFTLGGPLSFILMIPHKRSNICLYFKIPK